MTYIVIRMTLLPTFYFQRSPMPVAVAVMVVGAATGWLSFTEWPEGSPHPAGGTGQAVAEGFERFSFYMPTAPC